MTLVGYTIIGIHFAPAIMNFSLIVYKLSSQKSEAGNSRMLFKGSISSLLIILTIFLQYFSLSCAYHFECARCWNYLSHKSTNYFLLTFSPGASRSSRRSSLTSDVCSSKDHSPVDHKILHDVETQAKSLAHSVDKMLSDLQNNLHTVSLHWIIGWYVVIYVFTHLSWI